MMAAAGVKIRGYKMVAAWAGEKAGRLKLNRHLLSRPPLSDLEETEMLRLGVEGKAAGWRTLRLVAEHDRRSCTSASEARPAAGRDGLTWPARHPPA